MSMRFLLDGMLGKLTRWLRMIGYEATYLNDTDDSDLLKTAKQDSLTLLTSDEELYRTAIARGIDAFYVKGRTESERLAGLAARYGLNLAIDTSNSRCPVCGFLIKEIPKEDVRSRVPPATFKVYQTFWVCTNPDCAKIYWQGSHWKKIEQTLESAKNIIESKTGTTSPKQDKTKQNKTAPEPRRRKNPHQPRTTGSRGLSSDTTNPNAASRSY
jgi:uncharacterized protein with PIN domain